MMSAPRDDADNWSTSCLRSQAALYFGLPVNCELELVDPRGGRLSDNDPVVDEHIGVAFVRSRAAGAVVQ